MALRGPSLLPGRATIATKSLLLRSFAARLRGSASLRFRDLLHRYFVQVPASRQTGACRSRLPAQKEEPYSHDRPYMLLIPLGEDLARVMQLDGALGT